MPDHKPGKILVTCSLPMNAKNTDLVVAHTSSGAEELAQKSRKARVVSAFGTVPSEVFFGVFEARRTTNRPSMVYCEDDEGAKRVTATLIRDVGFDPVNAGACGWRATWNRSLRSWANSRTRVKAGRRSHTGSKDSRDEVMMESPSVWLSARERSR